MKLNPSWTIVALQYLLSTWLNVWCRSLTLQWILVLNIYINLGKIGTIWIEGALSSCTILIPVKCLCFTAIQEPYCQWHISEDLVIETCQLWWYWTMMNMIWGICTFKNFLMNNFLIWFERNSWLQNCEHLIASLLSWSFFYRYILMFQSHVHSNTKNPWNYHSL